MNELLSKLATEPAFEHMQRWRVLPLHGGRPDNTVLRLTFEEEDYVAKWARSTEIEVHRMLLGLDLKHVAVSVFPNLLNDGILVTRFVPGGILRDPALATDLVIEYAKVQNRLEPDVEVSAEARVAWSDYMVNALDTARLKLNTIETTPTVSELVKLVRALQPNWRTMATEYAQMPFAWLHYDFRERNLLAGPPQAIIGWGKSRGAGPFMHDIARFCLLHEPSFATFREVSDICRRSSEPKLRRWIHVATWANFVAKLRHFEEFESDFAGLLPLYQLLDPA